MNIATQEVVKKVITICPEGRLDSFAAPQLRSKLVALIEAGHNQIVLDLRNIEFMDSAGIAVLVNTLKRTRQTGGDTKLVTPHDESTMRMFRLTQFDKIFTMVDTPEDAINQF